MNEVIEKQLVGDFEKALFSAALENLEDRGNPLRFNNFAYAMRELVRHVMARLAPDDEVRACDWYKEETGRPNGISRRQRIYFAVQGGLSDEYVADELGLDVGKIHRRLRNSIDNLSKHTHIEEPTFNLGDEEVERFVNVTLAAVVGLFQTISECRITLVEAFMENLDASVVDAAISETILSIDELATHHCIDAVHTEQVHIRQIDAHLIHFVAEGTVECELQWGSNSDLRRGDGATLDQAYPFICELTSPVDNPGVIVTEESAFSADTSSWWEGYYDEE